MNIIIIGIGNIGFEVTKLLTDNNRILLIARNLSSHVKEFMYEHENVYYLPGDATNQLDMERIRDSDIVKRFGTIDLIVCTPGTTSDSTLFNDFKGFQSCFYLNYYAVVIPLKVFLKLMSVEKGGKLILLSASSGHHADTRLTGYPASKWALENTYSSLRDELKSINISVDVVAVRTIKNKYSKVWIQTYGEDPGKIAKYILRLIQKPKNKRHFVPTRYSLIRVVERLFPRLLDIKHGLRNKRSRKIIFRKMQSNIILITGAASGLGKAFASIYAKTAKVLYLCDIDLAGLVVLKKELTFNNECVINIAKVDILNEQEIISYSNSIDYIDLLINNAGVRYSGTIDDTSIDTFNHGFGINFFGPLLFIAQFFDKKIPPKKIINILSTSAIRGRKMFGLYSSSKAALWNVTRSLRRVYGSRIQILEVLPSFMSDSKLIENSILSVDEGTKSKNHEIKKINLQNRLKILRVRNWSVYDAANMIQKAERSGKEIVFVPPIKAKLFLILETTADWLFSKIFRI